MSESRATAIGLSAFSAAYFAYATTVASSRPFWYDEIITYTVGLQPGAAALWDLLGRGPDASAPLHPMIILGLYGLLPRTELVTRLPAIAGVWVMMLCMFAYVARGCGTRAAWVALLFPTSTLALVYAAEGRPYGLLLGVSALALVCWQAIGRASTPAGRGLARLGLAASLAASVASHYFAVLVFIPIGLGELARGRERRRVDRGTWAATLLGLSPLPACLPLIRHARSFSTEDFWAAGASLSDVSEYYRELLGPSFLPVLIALGLSPVAARWVRLGRRPAGPTPGEGPPPGEIAAAMGFAALPVFGIGLVQLGTEHAAFTVRYALPAVIGAGILASYAVSAIGTPAGLDRILALLLAASFAGRATADMADGPRIRGLEYLAGRLAAAGEPVVYCDFRRYSQLTFYGADPFRCRVVSLLGYHPEAASGDRIERLFRPLYPPDRSPWMEEYEDFIAARRRFLVHPDQSDALLGRLLDDGAAVERIRVGEEPFYRVTLPGPADPGRAAPVVETSGRAGREALAAPARSW